MECVDFGLTELIVDLSLLDEWMEKRRRCLPFILFPSPALTVLSISRDITKAVFRTPTI